jgi:hypothetical protein
MTPQELTDLRAKAVAATTPDGAWYSQGALHYNFSIEKEYADFMTACTPGLVIELVDELNFAQRDADQRWHKRYEQACQETKLWQKRYELLIREHATMLQASSVIVVKNLTVEDYNEHH